jgi:hypothetical protein
MRKSKTRTLKFREPWLGPKAFLVGPLDRTQPWSSLPFFRQIVLSRCCWPFPTFFISFGLFRAFCLLYFVIFKLFFYSTFSFIGPFLLFNLFFYSAFSFFDLIFCLTFFIRSFLSLDLVLFDLFFHSTFSSSKSVRSIFHPDQAPSFYPPIKVEQKRNLCLSFFPLLSSHPIIYLFSWFPACSGKLKHCWLFFHSLKKNFLSRTC